MRVACLGHRRGAEKGSTSEWESDVGAQSAGRVPQRPTRPKQPYNTFVQELASFGVGPAFDSERNGSSEGEISDFVLMCKHNREQTSSSVNLTLNGRNPW